MKEITFKNRSSTLIYRDYLKRLEKNLKHSSAKDRKNILMEFNSHIFEGIQRYGNIEVNETEKLMEVLNKLGDPQDVLKPMIAEKKLEEATRTFNPIHVFKALVLNITNGVKYIFFAFLYLVLIGFLIIIGAKINNPKEVGLYFKDGDFYLLGKMKPELMESLSANEVLGNWFIPFFLLLTVLLYIIITFLMRITARKK
ncbi:HAAS signaling domain-containing protein [Zunongwangia profunda]|uniref:HAAS signaling domain-containing protein n=1 Tax=Zunongwangia profunda TaxID=398743 RepID=UPI0030DA2C07|tara:strand:- start:7067 stop:7663 length:597 start_codon:yes stop_codon:yes gene_type:complete